MTNERGHRQCMYIIPTQYVEGRGYIPALVTENEPGYQLMSGQGEHAEPWYWGPSLEIARATADHWNEQHGIDKVQAMKIVASSMAAGKVGLP